MTDLYLMYGDRPEEMAKAILQEMKIEEDLLKLAKKLALSNKELLIGIKPNLVVAQPAEWGATTDPMLVRGVISYLKNCGFHNIIILESSWVGDSTAKAFIACGYLELSQEFQVTLVDLKKDKSRNITIDGLPISVCRQALAVNYLINMPVLKVHCQTRLTCALKNLKGCIPDREKRRFHTLGLHRPIACLNKALVSHLVIVDGIIGDLTHEEGGNPVRLNRVLAGRDPVLVDTFAAQLLGYETGEIEYIGLAAQLGVGSTNLQAAGLIELNSGEETPDPGKILAGREVDYLQNWIVADQACSACYSSLIHALMRLKEKGKLARLSHKIYLGQGFKNSTLGETGIGFCTQNFVHRILGCPPKTRDIVEFLENKIIR